MFVIKVRLKGGGHAFFNGYKPPTDTDDSPVPRWERLHALVFTTKSAAEKNILSMVSQNTMNNFLSWEVLQIMSSRTIYNPFFHVSHDTRERIKALGIGFDNFTTNIEASLRSLGENKLADTMLQEIELSLEERRRRSEN